MMKNEVEQVFVILQCRNLQFTIAGKQRHALLFLHHEAEWGFMMNANNCQKVSFIQYNVK